MLNVILGPTAIGKTRFAVEMALANQAEIISADSRQVFVGMDIGTGKDLADYRVGDRNIPYHLIDIRQAGEVYSVFDFYHDFHRVYQEIQSRGNTAILCGGTGLYIDAVLRQYDLRVVPENMDLRESLQGLSMEDLRTQLQSLKKAHNTTDCLDRDRCLRAIEIAQFQVDHPWNPPPLPEYKVWGLRMSRSALRTRITERLRERMSQGMVEEVEGLIQKGVPIPALLSYGLEYKFLTQMLLGQMDQTIMFEQLNTAIHQFAKRQETWFRGMERKGIRIHWIDRY